jgi:hypothetical protein
MLVAEARSVPKPVLEIADDTRRPNRGRRVQHHSEPAERLGRGAERLGRGAERLGRGAERLDRRGTSKKSARG